MGYGQTRSDWEARERAEKRLIEAVKANNLRVQRLNGKVFNISQNKYIPPGLIPQRKCINSCTSFFIMGS